MEKEELIKKLGEKIKEIRKKKGISQVELGRRINQEQQAIQRIEAGRINPSFYALYEIAKGLEIELKELINI